MENVLIAPHARRPPPPPVGAVSPPRPRQPQPQQAPQGYGAWLYSTVQAAAQSGAVAVQNATATIGPVASRTYVHAVQGWSPYAQQVVQQSQRAYNNLPPIIPPIVKANISGAVSGVAHVGATAVQMGREVVTHPEVPLAYIRGAFSHNFGPQSEIPPAYAILLPPNLNRLPSGPPPPPPAFRNVDPSLMRAEPPPDAAQEGKEIRELTVDELLELLTANLESFANVADAADGLTIDEKLRKIAETSSRNMAERGITEGMLARAFARYDGDSRVHEVVLKSRAREERILANVEMPAWLTADKLLEIMQDLQEANREIFPEVVQAELAGHVPPDLMEKCIQINQRCYQKHGVTEMQLQTAAVRYQSDPDFAAKLQRQQAEASAQAQALMAQLQAQQRQ